MSVPIYGTENAGYPMVLGFAEPEVIYTPSDSLGITDQVSVVKIYARSINDAMSITQQVLVASAKPVSATSTIALTQSALRIIEATANNVMEIDSDVTGINFVDDRKVAGDTLNLTQTVLSSASAPISQVLGITDSVQVQAPYYLAVNHWLALSHRLPTPFFLDVEDELGLVQQLPTPLYGNASDTLNIIDEASITNLVDTLNLTHSAQASKLYEVAHTLNIQHSITLESDWVRRVDEDIGIGHAMTYFVDDPCSLKNYSPFQGENTVNTAFASPSATIPPTFKDASTDRLTLYYPSAAAIARQLVIRAPEFGNRDQNSYTRVSRETRGGKLVVYADPDWPELRTLACTVTGLKAAEVEEYLTFMYATLGKTIEICDWEGRLWTGVLVNPEEPITQDGKERFTISFQLEGRMYETALPETENDGFQLNITDSATAVIV